MDRGCRLRQRRVVGNRHGRGVVRPLDVRGRDVRGRNVRGGPDAGAGTDEGGAHDLGARAQPVRVQLAARARDRDADGAGPGVEHALDRRRGSLVERTNPEPPERDEDRGREGDEHGKTERAHAAMVATASDGIFPALSELGVVVRL